MSDFMSDQTPLRLGSGTNTCPRNCPRTLLRAIRLTQRPEPRYPHFRVCRARTHQMPKTGSIVPLGSSPRAEIAQSCIEGNVRVATYVPFFP